MSGLLPLFLAFFRIGLFTIGGGYAMLPLIQNELVGGGYISLDEMLNIISISQVTPGPFSLNAATFVGMELYGVLGAVLCTLGLVLPSAVILGLAASFFFNIHETPAARAVLYGARPAVLGLIVYSTLTLARAALMPNPGTLSLDYAAAAVAVSVFAALSAFKRVRAVVLILLAGLVGAVFLRGA